MQVSKFSTIKRICHGTLPFFTSFLFSLSPSLFAARKVLDVGSPGWCVFFKLTTLASQWRKFFQVTSYNLVLRGSRLRGSVDQFHFSRSAEPSDATN